MRSIERRENRVSRRQSLALTGTIFFAAALMVLGSSGEAEPASAADNSQKNGPDVSATLVPAAMMALPPTATPTIAATPDVLATRIAEIKQTAKDFNELRDALDSLRGPTSAPAQQAPAPGVVVVPRDIVQVPQIVRETVVVPATPNPGLVSLNVDALNTVTELRAEEIVQGTVRPALTQAVGANATAESAKNEAVQAKIRTAALENKGWSFDWWSALIGGAVTVVITGVVVRMVNPARTFVIERLGGAVIHEE